MIAEQNNTHFYKSIIKRFHHTSSVGLYDSHPSLTMIGEVFKYCKKDALIQTSNKH